jgi:Interferon-inducible GTPase (IIGP).
MKFTPEQEKVMQSAIATFGIDDQTIKAIEEFSELNVELAKMVNAPDFFDQERYDAMVEEMADSHIMLYQLKTMYKVSDEELNLKIFEKLKRLEELIDFVRSD